MTAHQLASLVPAANVVYGGWSTRATAWFMMSCRMHHLDLLSLGTLKASSCYLPASPVAVVRFSVGLLAAPCC